jgi:hypothetical protein
VASDPGPESGDYDWPDYERPSYGPPSYRPMPPYGGSLVPSGQSLPYGNIRPSMRAATADRDRTMDVIKAAYSEGRLTRDEFDERAARVLSARTYGELAGLVADLPQGPYPTVAPYQAGYYVEPLPRTNGCAAAALIFGILPLFCGVPAVILGHVARAQIRRTGERGIGMATTGLVLGYIWIGFITLLFIIGLSH